MSRFRRRKSRESNGFRAWLDERIRTALRVVGGAKSGHVNPTVVKIANIARLGDYVLQQNWGVNYDFSFNNISA